MHRTEPLVWYNQWVNPNLIFAVFTQQEIDSVSCFSFTQKPRRFTVKLTTQELEQMRSVDIGAVAAESLPDVSGMTFDNALSRKERISRFLQTVKNPYCFCIGGVGVKIEFAESGPSLQDKLTDFLLRQRSGL